MKRHSMRRDDKHAERLRIAMEMQRPDHIVESDNMVNERGAENDSGVRKSGAGRNGYNEIVEGVPV